ncbi:hypothetical protein QUW15_13535 [Desulfovibrio piger]|nr:hypothetical protein [Desulfovibrio piger]
MQWLIDCYVNLWPPISHLIREKDFCSIYDRQIKPTANFLLAIQGEKSLEKEKSPSRRQSGRASIQQVLRTRCQTPKLKQGSTKPSGGRQVAAPAGKIPKGDFLLWPLPLSPSLSPSHKTVLTALSSIPT